MYLDMHEILLAAAVAYSHSKNTTHVVDDTVYAALDKIAEQLRMAGAIDGNIEAQFNDLLLCKAQLAQLEKDVGDACQRLAQIARSALATMDGASGSAYVTPGCRKARIEELEAELKRLKEQD